MKLKEVSKPMTFIIILCLFVKLEEIKKVDALKINSIETKKK